MLPDGNLKLSDVRIGQGEEWRDHWLALSFDIGVENTLEAVQIAAKLLRCSALSQEITLGKQIVRQFQFSPTPNGFGVRRGLDAHDSWGSCK